MGKQTDKERKTHRQTMRKERNRQTIKKPSIQSHHLPFPLLCVPVLSLAFSDTDDEGFERTRRGWSMMRLGRGLQMLRLGKRTAHPAPAVDGTPSTPEQMRAMLSTMMDESRNEFRRQPPLPRYGRELEVAQDSAEELYSLLGDAYLSRVLPLHFNRYVHANRFKRSAVVGTRYQNQLSDFDQSDEDSSRTRAVALPRIGRYLGRLYKFRPAKAVPAPRIGRQEMDLVTDKEATDSGVNGQGRSEHYVTRQDTSYRGQQTAGAKESQVTY